jgi:hypothetical protein
MPAPPPPRVSPTHREIRATGVVVLVGFAALAWMLERRGLPVAARSLAGVGLAWAALAWASPRTARPLHQAWMCLGEFIGRVTTPLLLVVVFVLVVVPTRLFLLLRGIDPLERRLDRSASSYWHERRPGAFDRASFERSW